MTEYEKQAEDFLKECNAVMDIKFDGLEKPNWDDKKHAAYDCTITTPHGKMDVRFYDSSINTEFLTMSVSDYLKKYHKLVDVNPFDIRYRKAATELKRKKQEAIPTSYDILACLNKYDVGTMDDFMSEFGYEIKCVEDMTDFINTYNAVVKEYQDICRCFTDEQIEKLREIQ